MKFTVQGQAYELLNDDDLSWGECDLLERTLGMSLAQIRRAAQTCVCGDPQSGHRIKDGFYTSCKVCDCPAFASNRPAKVTAGKLWISMHRDREDFTFDEFNQIPQSEFAFGEEADPPEPPKGG